MHILNSAMRAVSLLALAGLAQATNLNVAILSAIDIASQDTNVLNSISPNAPFLNITTLNVYNTTPDLLQLENYAAVMVVSNNPFQSPGSLGDALKNYVDAGHGVVIASYAECTNWGGNVELGGGFASADYWAIEPGSCNSASHPTLGTVHSPSSPLLTNVNTLDGGSGASLDSGAVNAAATDVIDWSTGVPLVAVRSFSGGGIVVGLNLYPPNSLAFGTLWASSTDGGKLMADALAYAAGSPITSGSVSTPEGGGLLTAGFGIIGLSLLSRSRRRRETLQFKSDSRPRQR